MYRAPRSFIVSSNQLKTLRASRARAKLVEHLGGEILAHVVLPDGTALNVKTHGHGEVTRDSDVQLGVRGELAYLFTEAGACLASLRPREMID